jgi:hypothetical protein
MATISRSVLILAALGMAGSTPAAQARHYGAVVLGDHGSNFAKVRPNEGVEIRLKTQAGTGYSWRPTSYQSKIHSLPPMQSRGMMPGGKETQRFLFQTRHKGFYILTFSYGQPWKGGAKGAKSRSFTVQVR